MKLSLIPVFCTVGVKFVVDHRALGWLQREVGGLVEPGPEFVRRYGSESKLVIYMDGDSTIGVPRVLGPRFLKKAHELEMRVIVPMTRPIVESDEEVCAIVGVILRVLIDELEKCGIDTRALAQMPDSLVDRFSKKEWLNGKPAASGG